MQRNERQTTILNSVIAIIAEQGIGAVTHRATDAAAQLPPGSTTYYFPKKLDLLRATATHLAFRLERDCDRLQIGFAELAARQGLNAAIDFVARYLVTSLDESKPLHTARIELALAASRSTELLEVKEQLLAAGRRPIEFFVHLIADGKREVPLDICVGLIDGIALMHITGQNSQVSAEQTAAVLRWLVLNLGSASSGTLEP